MPVSSPVHERHRVMVGHTHSYSVLVQGCGTPEGFPTQVCSLGRRRGGKPGLVHATSTYFLTRLWYFGILCHIKPSNWGWEQHPLLKKFPGAPRPAVSASAVPIPGKTWNVYPEAHFFDVDGGVVGSFVQFFRFSSPCLISNERCTISTGAGKASVELIPILCLRHFGRGARAQMLYRVRWRQLNCQGKCQITGAAWECPMSSKMSGYLVLPVVPHKAVAEVSRRGKL